MKFTLDSELWRKLEISLGSLSKNYDWLNKLLSFGQDNKVRMEVVKLIDDNDVVLELGPGNGVLAEKIKCKEYWGLDPLRPMIEFAQQKIMKKTHNFKLGIAERIPFENEKFDKVVCSFSFRDFKDKEKAVKEIYRVLKKGGKLLILDLANGKNPIKYLFLTYFRFLNTCIGRIVKRTELLSLDSFINSIRKLASPDDLGELLKLRGFRKVYIKYLLMGAVFLLIAEK